MRSKSNLAETARQAPPNGFRAPYTQPEPGSRSALKGHSPLDQSPLREIDPNTTRGFVHIRSTENFFVIPRPVLYLSGLSLVDVVFLFDLMNRAEMTTNWLDDNWFQCTQRFLRRHGIGPDNDQQKLRFRSLKNQKLIETKCTGMPPVRYVRFNVPLLKELFESAYDKYYQIKQEIESRKKRKQRRAKEAKRRQQDGD